MLRPAVTTYSYKAYSLQMFLCDTGGFSISILTIFYLIVANYSNYFIQLDSVNSLIKRRNKETVFDP